MMTLVERIAARLELIAEGVEVGVCLLVEKKRTRDIGEMVFSDARTPAPAGIRDAVLPVLKQAYVNKLETIACTCTSMTCDRCAVMEKYRG